MREIDERSAEAYLRDTGRIPADRSARVRMLAGGVSNVVLHVALPRGEFVLKQSRGRLRVAEPWYCSVERIWREIDVLAACGRLLDDAPPTPGLRLATPRLLFEDRANYLFAMSAVDPSHRVWKECLLAGEARTEVAEAAGRLLAALHAGSWHAARWERQLADRQYFLQLRVDPYYRHLARNDPTLREPVEGLCESLDRHRCGLVHGDFSPKNLLVTSDALTLVDFEVGHYGDVAFDLGFFLSHLVLKTFHAPRRAAALLELIRRFWSSYRAGMSGRLTPEELRRLEARGLLHLAGCGLARLDGKSPVEYLPDARRRETIRRMFRGALAESPDGWDAWEAWLRGFLPPPLQTH